MSDPNALLAAIRERVEHLRQNLGEGVGPLPLVDAIEDLDRWLSKGGFPPHAWQVARPNDLHDATHILVLTAAQKMDADPRTFARAICSCGDYTSSVDSPSGATRAWLAHWTAKTKGIGNVHPTD